MNKIDAWTSKVLSVVISINAHCETCETCESLRKELLLGQGILTTHDRFLTLINTDVQSELDLMSAWHKPEIAHALLLYLYIKVSSALI